VFGVEADISRSPSIGRAAKSITARSHPPVT
jgi:hypothetical protein